MNKFSSRITHHSAVKSKRSFTLIELLVVIAMITILPLQNFKKPLFVICL